jgi:hypothetical protein
LTRRPLSISSAVWIADRQQIAAVDTLRNQVLLVSTSGKVEVFPSPAQSLPAEIIEIPKGFLLKRLAGPPQVLDRTFRPAQKVSSPESFRPAGLSQVYAWTAAGRDLVGLGRLQRSARQRHGETSAGVFRINGSPGGRLEALGPPVASTSYVLGNRYFASLGDWAYWVLMDAKPRIYEAAPGKAARALRAFPAEYQKTPKLPARLAGPSQASTLLREVERLALPVGLYGQGTRLYLLVRKPGVAGRTIWSIFPIDPRTDQIAGELRLPTSAPQLTVVPTPRAWYLFEKGTVETTGAQIISSLLSIPSPWLDSPDTSPLRARRLRVRRCPNSDAPPSTAFP